MQLSHIGNAKTAAVVFAALLLYAYGFWVGSNVNAACLPPCILLDFTAFIPALVYFGAVRPRGVTPLAMLPVLWAGLGLSAVALGLPPAETLIAPAACIAAVELAILAHEAEKMARTFRAARLTCDDPAACLRRAAESVLDNTLPARLVALELSIWHYALFTWGKRHQLEPNEFSYHEKSGYTTFVLGLTLALPAEAVALHLAVSPMSPAAAWLLVLLSLYSVGWLAGDARACLFRPIRITNSSLIVNRGTMFTAEIPLSAIAGISTQKPECAQERVVDQGFFRNANVWITFAEPVELGLWKRDAAAALGISVDDPIGFIQAVRETAA